MANYNKLQTVRQLKNELMVPDIQNSAMTSKSASTVVK